MTRMMRGRTWLAALTIALLAASTSFGQDKPAEGAAAPKAPEAKGPYRKLAPGVLESVDPARQLNESFSRHSIGELLGVDPNFDWAKDVPFRHNVWSLAFKFKQVRMVWVDIPKPTGKMERKLIWYLVYSVTNTGQMMVPVEDKELGYETVEGKKVWEVKKEDKPVRFIPTFRLEARDRMAEGEGFVKVYPDTLLPVAIAPIEAREDRNRKLANTIEMCREIKVGETVWGVATWQDIDPRTVRFSIYIQGLTNAYRWKDEEASLKAGDSLGGRRRSMKTLLLNFWRPGDEYFENEGEIRYGRPGAVDYEWVYR